MHRRILAYLTALALLASLAACAKKPAETPDETGTLAPETTAGRGAEGDVATPQPKPETQPAETQADSTRSDETQPVITPSEAQAMNTNTGPLFQKYVREKVADNTYTLRTEQSGMKFAVAVDGEDSAVDSDASGILRFSLVHKDGSYYMVMHSTKKYTKMSEEEYKKQMDSVDSSSAVDLDNMRFLSSGTESVKGKRYSTETYDEGDQGVVTYFFDETGVRRTRVVKDGKTTEADVFTVLEDPDASMFEIPGDYTLVSDPSKLMA